MMNATATKILITNEKDLKRVYAVEFMHDGKSYTVGVKKEAILSGGAVNSPQLLLLSGIGPRDEVTKVGIPLIHELPGVGKNLHNHVAYFLTYVLKNTTDINDLNWANALQYLLQHNGPLSSTGMSQVTGILNSKYADPSGSHPDLQMFFAAYLANCAQSGAVDAYADPDDPTAHKHLYVTPVVLHPKSRGTITLKSANPLDAPVIRANYLTEPEDMATLIDGIRKAQVLGSAKILKEKYGAELDTSEEADCGKKHKYDSDDYWDCAIRHGTGPENHQAGSCKMGPASDPMAVVDNELKVYGVKGLRVIDCSVMPMVTSGNTAAPAMMIAEKGSDMIKARWNKSTASGSAPELADRFGSPDNPNYPPLTMQPPRQEPYPDHKKPVPPHMWHRPPPKGGPNNNHNQWNHQPWEHQNGYPYEQQYEEGPNDGSYHPDYHYHTDGVNPNENPGRRGPGIYY